MLHFVVLAASLLTLRLQVPELRTILPTSTHVKSNTPNSDRTLYALNCRKVRCQMLNRHLSPFATYRRLNPYFFRCRWAGKRRRGQETAQQWAEGDARLVAAGRHLLGGGMQHMDPPPPSCSMQPVASRARQLRDTHIPTRRCALAHPILAHPIPTS